jgi:hypothetical protein
MLTVLIVFSRATHFSPVPDRRESSRLYLRNVG